MKNIKIINSLNNPIIKKYKKLLLKKNRLKYKKFLVEGWHLVDMAKKNQCLEEVILLQNTQYDFKKIIYTNDKIIRHLSSTNNPQEIMGIVFIKEPKLNYNQTHIILENIQDPGNMGTILRNCLAFNFKNIILSNDCVDLYNPKVVRSTQGAIFDLNIVKHDVNIFLQKFKGDIVATSLDESSFLIKNDLKINKPYCLIFGNESNGIKKETLAQAQYKIKIGITKNIDSLNVAVASGIILNHFKNI